MTLGDVLACPKPFAVAVLTAALSRLGVETNAEAVKQRLLEFERSVNRQLSEMRRDLEK